MRMTQTVLVCGVPGVGKTNLIRTAVADIPDAGFCEAQELVRHAATTDFTSTFGTSAAHRVARHFHLLGREFSTRREQTRKRVMVLESASVVETEAGWFEPPLHVLKVIDPQVMVHVEDDCERIAQRCLRDRSTVRLTRSAIELARYQNRSLRACEQHAERVGCAIRRMRADAYEDFKRLISTWVAHTTE
jgi:adenylate kinase